MAVALVALALGALSATASAAPVFFGKAAIGSKVEPVSFSGTLGAAFLEGKSGTKITCKAGTAVGEVTGATTTGEKRQRNSRAAKSAACRVKTLVPAKSTPKSWRESWVASRRTVPGIRLFDQGEGKGGKLAQFTCAAGSIAVAVKGSVIGSLSGASGKTVEEGKLATSLKLTFAESKGLQKYKKFVVEGEPGEEQLESSVGGGPFEPSGQSVIATLKTTPAGQLGVTK